MIEFSIGKSIIDEGVKIVGGILKFRQHSEEQKEDEKMLAIFDDLRRTTYSNAGNLLYAEIGSDLDRLYQKMVTKGYLVWDGLGYMLPGKSRGFGASSSPFGRSSSY